MLKNSGFIPNWLFGVLWVGASWQFSTIVNYVPNSRSQRTWCIPKPGRGMSFWNVFWIQTDQNECERAQNVTRKALFNGIKKVIWNLSVARFRLADFKTAVQNGIPRLGSYGWIREFSGYQMTFLKCFQSVLTSGKVRIVPNQSKTTISGPSIEHPKNKVWAGGGLLQFCYDHG